MDANSRFDLEERLLDYAANIVRVAESIRVSPAGTHVANQMLRSGTSVLPNHGEAQAAESNADFIHKLSICLKELRETRRLAAIDPEGSFDREAGCRATHAGGNRGVDSHFLFESENSPQERHKMNGLFERWMLEVER
jgi:four helix bundle protein